MVRVVVVEGGADVLPVVGERRGDLLLGGDDHRGVGGREVEEGVEPVDRQQLGDVRAVLGVLERGDLRQLAVLGGELGRGRDLDAVGLAQARCVNVENQRSDSISMSNRSTRTARSSVAG